MIGYAMVGTNDLAKAKSFYDALLGEMGAKVLMDVGRAAFYGTTMGQLAEALDLAPSAVSGLVQRMEALHWVQRRPCPRDARTQRVWLLDPGRTQLPALKQALKRVNARLHDGFSDEELHTVARWLRHVQHLDDHPSP